MATAQKVAGFKGLLKLLRDDYGYEGGDTVDEVLAYAGEIELNIGTKAALIKAHKEYMRANVEPKEDGGLMIELQPEAAEDAGEGQKTDDEEPEDAEKARKADRYKDANAQAATEKRLRALEDKLRQTPVATGGGLNIDGRKSFEKKVKEGRTAFTTPEAAVAFWSERVAKSSIMRQRHPEVYKRANARLEQLGFKAGNTGPGFNGAATLASLYVPDLINLRDQYGTLAGELSSYTVEKDSLERSRLSGDLLSSVYHPDENETWTKSNNQYDKIHTSPKRDAIMVQMSKDLFQLSELDQAEEAVRESRRALGYAEDQAIANGDGTSTYGGRVGLKGRFETLGITGSAGTDGTYYYVGGDNWAAHTFAYLNNWMSLLPAYVFDIGNPKIYCSKKFQISVLNRLTQEAGGVTMAERRNGDPTLNAYQGYEVVTSEVFNRNSDTGANTIDAYFGDLSLSGMIHYTRAMDIEISDQVFFDSDDIAVRAINRYDSLFHDIGSSSQAGPVVALVQT